MQQIADWLEKLGMSEYAERFAENGIEVEALPHLTDQDLKDIGVLLGHRRIMLGQSSEDPRRYDRAARRAARSPSPRRAHESTVDAELNDFGVQLAMLGGHAAD